MIFFQTYITITVRRSGLLRKSKAMNNIYNFQLNSIEYNARKMQEFSELIERMREADYEERVKIMKETWSQELISQLPNTIHYGDYCHVKIFIEDNKYRFEFNYDNISLEKLEKMHSNLLSNEDKMKIQKMKQDFESKFYNTKTDLNNYNDINNLTSYRNININKK